MLTCEDLNIMQYTQFVCMIAICLWSPNYDPGRILVIAPFLLNERNHPPYHQLPCLEAGECRTEIKDTSQENNITTTLIRRKWARTDIMRNCYSITTTESMYISEWYADPSNVQISTLTVSLDVCCLDVPMNSPSTIWSVKTVHTSSSCI